MNIYELINNEKNLEITTNNKNNIVDNNDTYLNSNECLISNKPLDNNYITLDCNHKFNYQELYDEFKYQKTNKNYYDTSRPLPHQIKCPYCVKMGALRVMKRWHFDNCKHKILENI